MDVTPTSLVHLTTTSGLVATLSATLGNLYTDIVTVTAITNTTGNASTWYSYGELTNITGQSSEDFPVAIDPSGLAARAEPYTANISISWLRPQNNTVGAVVVPISLHVQPEFEINWALGGIGLNLTAAEASLYACVLREGDTATASWQMLSKAGVGVVVAADSSSPHLSVLPALGHSWAVEDWHHNHTFYLTANDDDIYHGDRVVPLLTTIRIADADELALWQQALNSTAMSIVSGAGLPGEYTVQSNVLVLEDDLFPLDITMALPLSLTEGVARSVEVRMNYQPLADVLWTFPTSAQVTFEPTALVFTAANWNSSQLLSFLAVDEGLIEGFMPFRLPWGTASVSADPAYNNLTPAPLELLLMDGELAYESISPRYAYDTTDGEDTRVTVVFPVGTRLTNAPTEALGNLSAVPVFCHFGYQQCPADGPEPERKQLCYEAFMDLDFVTTTGTSMPSAPPPAPPPVPAVVVNARTVQCLVSKCLRGSWQGADLPCQGKAALWMLDFTVVAGGQPTVNNQGWEYISLPTIDRVSPTEGPVHGTTIITLIGTGFRPLDAGGYCVVGGSRGVSLTYIDATTMHCEAGPRADLEGKTTTVPVVIQLVLDGQNTLVGVQAAWGYLDLRTQAEAQARYIFVLTCLLLLVLFVFCVLKTCLCKTATLGTACCPQQQEEEEHHKRLVQGPQLLINEIEAKIKAEDITKPIGTLEWGSPAVLADKRNPEDADKGTKSNFLIQLGMMPVEAGTPPSPSPSEQE